MLVWTDVAHDARVLREMAALVEAGHTIHVVGRAVPADWTPPPGVTVSSARARSPFRAGDAPSTESAKGPAAPGALPAAKAAARRLVRWLLLPEHVVVSLRTWTDEAYADAAGRAFDVVHVHDFTALALGHRLAGEHGVPLVYDAHEWWSGRARHGRPEPLRRRRQAAQEQRLARDAVAVLTVSEGIAQRFRAWGVRDVAVVRNTFPLGDVEAGHGGAADRQPVAGQGLRGVLYAGRVAEGRDLGTALAAAPLPDGARLVLMGPADHGYLPSPLPPGVELRPAVQVDQVDDVLRELGAALVSLEDSCDNHRLALPNKVFQAVRAGVPVVAADLPELARLVRAHGLGTLYRPGDPRSLAQAVAALSRTWPETVASVRAARAELRWEVDVQRLLEVYRRLPAPGGVPASLD